LKQAYGGRDDYIKQGDEHTLNEGEWSWMNYIEKGEKKPELFIEFCPKTTELLEKVIG
jgi:aspartyl/asparaginyl beta-hydroxylase (cupin superfamily)